jgi:uncharacterized damage-inducible protein DinB
MDKPTTSLTQVRDRHIWQMKTTCLILEHVLKNISEDQAHELQDGPEGWSIIEIVCHLRDFDEIFYSRAKMMLEQDYPQLPAYDHEAIAIEKKYQEEELAYVYYDLKDSRERFVAFFESLTDEQWERAGVHPERESFTMTDALMQVGLHDIDHTEQITRILEQEDPESGIIPDDED